MIAKQPARLQERQKVPEVISYWLRYAYLVSMQLEEVHRNNWKSCKYSKVSDGMRL